MVFSLSVFVVREEKFSPQVSVHLTGGGQTDYVSVTPKGLGVQIPAPSINSGSKQKFVVTRLVTTPSLVGSYVAL